MFFGEGVGGVDVVVAQQAELGRVGSAVEDGTVFVAIIAGYAIVYPASRFGTNHL